MLIVIDVQDSKYLNNLVDWLHNFDDPEIVLYNMRAWLKGTHQAIIFYN